MDSESTWHPLTNTELANILSAATEQSRSWPEMLANDLGIKTRQDYIPRQGYRVQVAFPSKKIHCLFKLKYG